MKSRGAPYRKRGSYPQQNHSSHTSRTNSAAGPAIPVSAESKSKLGAFAFSKPSTPRKTATGVESEPGTNDGDTAVLEDTDAMAGSLPDPVPDPVKECPKTPAPRLPLSDLIGLGDEGGFTQVVPQADASPEDRIMWQLSPRGTPSASQTTPAVKKEKRGKKRPLNSALMSSPNVDSPAVKKRQKGVSNLQRLGTTFKAPFADPAMQLWSKYSAGSGSGSTNARAINPAARLFGAEGSQRGGLNQSPGGLRRSYSCGPDWPHSRLKRRKTNSSEDVPELDESIEEQLIKVDDLRTHGLGPSRLSRVSRLVEKMKETLEKPSSMPNIPSSSSPLPYTHDHLDLASSPTRRIAGRRSYEDNNNAVGGAECVNDGSSDTEDFGDFDDDDIDMVMLEKVDKLAASQAVPQSVLFAEPMAKLRVSPLLEELKLPPPAEEQKLPSPEEDDEFDDGDDAFYTEDFENIISKYETQTAQSMPATNLAQNVPQMNPQEITNALATQVLVEFGDIDFDEWDEEALQLTNGMVRISSPARVCRTSNDFKKDLKPKSIKRYLVENVSLGKWKWKNHAIREEKVCRISGH